MTIITYERLVEALIEKGITPEDAAIKLQLVKNETCGEHHKAIASQEEIDEFFRVAHLVERGISTAHWPSHLYLSENRVD